jgi:hypothetical protein
MLFTGWCFSSDSALILRPSGPSELAGSAQHSCRSCTPRTQNRDCSAIARSCKRRLCQGNIFSPARATRVNETLERRLAVIMHRAWVDGTECRWTREVAAA